MKGMGKSGTDDRARGAVSNGRARVALSVALAVTLALGMTAPDACRAAKERTAPFGKTYTWSFQADTLGQKPAHSMTFGGTWQVVEDSTDAPHRGVITTSAPSATADSVVRSVIGIAAPVRRFLSQSENEDGIAFHYLTFTRPMLGDMDASVRFRIRSGEVDPCAGLMFQMNPRGTSGYGVRISGKTGELAFHYLLYGKKRDLKFAKIPPLQAGSWHTLAVTRRRTLLRVSYDGKELMAVRDDRFSKGTIGVWSGDDTVVDFADLTATAR